MAKKILIVDDTKSVRAVIGTTLKMAGYNTLAAEDGVEALDIIQKPENSDIALVITDMNMPNMDGPALIKRLKSDSKLSGLPICVLTTESEQGKHNDEIGGLKDAWITKPVQPAHVLNVVSELLGDS